MNDTLAPIVRGLILGLVIALIFLVKGLASDIDTIKEFTDPAKHCNGEVLWNSDWKVWECKSSKVSSIEESIDSKVILGQLEDRCGENHFLQWNEYLDKWDCVLVLEDLK